MNPTLNVLRKSRSFLREVSSAYSAGVSNPDAEYWARIFSIHINQSSEVCILTPAAGKNRWLDLEEFHFGTWS